MKAIFHRFVRASRLSMVMLIGILLLAIPAATVHAAPPSLTASQNPVVIPVGQTTGLFTLAWNSGIGGPIELYGTVTGGPENGPWLGAATGSTPVTITYGDTFVYSMYLPGKKELLATVKITTVRPDNACAQQCIKGVMVDPHGTFANFHIITTHPVKVILEAHEDGQPVASSTFNLTQMTDWQTALLNLKPNTKYIYNVKANDGTNTQYSTGTFKTLRRQVQVDFTDIKVIDDSDFASAGDLIFWFNVNGAWNHNFLFPSSGEAEIDSGTTVHPNHVENLIDAPDMLTLSVFGWDDDCDFGQFCTEGIGPGGAAGGSDSEADWATAGGKTNIALSGPGEAYTDSLSFTTTQWSLKYSVTATYTVSYSP